MNRKFKMDKHQVCVHFKNDNNLSMTVEYLPTGEYFINENIELIRIKKDTVIATLERKSEKHLLCQFQHFLHQDAKTLVVSFIVNFDYLPEFKEVIELEFLEKVNNSVKVGNFHAEIEEMDTAITNFQKSGFTLCNEVGQTNLMSTEDNKRQFYSKKIGKGKYLLKLSSMCTGTTGTSSIIGISFDIILANKEVIKVKTDAYSMGGYCYPLSFTEILDTEEGTLRIEAFSSVACNLSNTHIVLSPIMQIC